MARVRVKGIREENRRRRTATAIQCMIRFRGARHNSAARNRHRGIPDTKLVAVYYEMRLSFPVFVSVPNVGLVTLPTVKARSLVEG